MDGAAVAPQPGMIDLDAKALTAVTGGLGASLESYSLTDLEVMERRCPKVFKELTDRSHSKYATQYISTSDMSSKCRLEAWPATP